MLVIVLDAKAPLPIFESCGPASVLIAPLSIPVRVVRVAVWVVKVKVGEDKLDSLVRLGDQCVSTEHVGRVRVWVERRHYRSRLHGGLAFFTPP